VPNWAPSRPFYDLLLKFFFRIKVSRDCFETHFYCVRSLVSTFYRSKNKFNSFRGEAHERFQRVRVFHAHPLSSFSRNFSRNLRWVRGPTLTRAKVEFPSKRLKNKYFFFQEKFSSILGTGCPKIGHRVPKNWAPEIWAPDRPPP
jgi:hypothetical protein